MPRGGSLWPRHRPFDMRRETRTCPSSHEREAQGSKNEHRTMLLLEASGYACNTRAAASLGAFDVIGISPLTLWRRQAKSNSWPRSDGMVDLEGFPRASELPKTDSSLAVIERGCPTRRELQMNEPLELSCDVCGHVTVLDAAEQKESPKCAEMRDPARPLHLECRCNLQQHVLRSVDHVARIPGVRCSQHRGAIAANSCACTACT